MIRLHLISIAVVCLFVSVLAHAQDRPKDAEQKALAVYDMVYHCIKAGGSYMQCRAYVLTAIKQMKQ